MYSVCTVSTDVCIECIVYVLTCDDLLPICTLLSFNVNDKLGGLPVAALRDIDND